MTIKITKIEPLYGFFHPTLVDPVEDKALIELVKEKFYNLGESDSDRQFEKMYPDFFVKKVKEVSVISSSISSSKSEEKNSSQSQVVSSAFQDYYNKFFEKQEVHEEKSSSPLIPTYKQTASECPAELSGRTTPKWKESSSAPGILVAEDSVTANQNLASFKAAVLKRNENYFPPLTKAEELAAKKALKEAARLKKGPSEDSNFLTKATMGLTDFVLL